VFSQIDEDFFKYEKERKKERKKLLFGFKCLRINDWIIISVIIMLEGLAVYIFQRGRSYARYTPETECTTQSFK